MLIEKKIKARTTAGKPSQEYLQGWLGESMLRSAVIMWASVGSDSVRRVVVLWNQKRVLTAQHAIIINGRVPSLSLSRA